MLGRKKKFSIWKLVLFTFNQLFIETYSLFPIYATRSVGLFLNEQFKVLGTVNIEKSEFKDFFLKMIHQRKNNQGPNIERKAFSIFVIVVYIFFCIG